MAEVKQALQESETGSAMHLPKRKRVISSQWVFAIKKQLHNHSTKYTRLVINGFSHPERIDYFKAFAQEVRYKWRRLLLSIATKEDLEIVKFNVKTAFVYWELEEEIHLYPSESCIQKSDILYIEVYTDCGSHRALVTKSLFYFYVNSIIDTSAFFVGDIEFFILYKQQ